MSDSDDDEDFAYYGTPVEQLDEDESIPRKAPRLEDQIAKDKQGRRRFERKENELQGLGRHDMTVKQRARSIEEQPKAVVEVPVDGPPTMDLFKAIFQDSDSDTDDDNKKTDDTKPTHKNVEAYHGTANLLPQKPTVLDENGENLSPVTEVQEDPVSRFLSSIRSDQGKQNNADNVTEKRKIDGRRKRVSRFEPQAEDGIHNIQYPNSPTLEPSISIQDSSQSTEHSNFRADLPKPVFIPKKKESVATKPTPSQGIFADVDFSALNSLWNSQASSSQEASTVNSIDQIQPKPGVENSQAEVKGVAHIDVDSDSSTDPESEYGPAVPSHLRHQAQMVRSVPTTSVDLVQKLACESLNMTRLL
ncbi:hypothetical protein Pcinc_021317 [Petrolisthes cinctipes]|uniref:Uncharacterized protein n=1 Tax=Petrolisthes cinctipes TaxID=88211 RepID=A0AAE1FG47_PETCI|nr:hypothetical protein Pcinc_021317 [Petrolisthes cinctipes]